MEQYPLVGQVLTRVAVVNKVGGGGQKSRKAI